MTSATCWGHEIAITIDDLPGQQNESAEDQRTINERILKALKKFQAPAIGFVNEGRLYDTGQEKEKIAILKLWIDYGQTLGNHTYSHNFLSSSKLDEFERDVINGSIISKSLMQNASIKYQYFRHPYLDTGTNKNIRSKFESFLKKEGYVIAPVTIDTDDWKFNQQLLEKPESKKKIITKYLEHTKRKFAFYENASKKIFGRNIKHIWLLHDNLLNSYAMEDLLQLTSELNYKVITIDEALKDHAYLEPDNYYAAFGVSWLYRWDFTRGKVVDWSQDPEPDNNPFIKTESLDLFDKSRNRKIPVELYASRESEGKAEAKITKLPVAIISHGNTIKNTEYSFLANSLAAQGYLVVSIQHQLETDPKLATTGSLFQRRLPLWETGEANISFVINYLKSTDRNLDLNKMVLIGHSHGGDITMLFTTKHPELVSKTISLDSLRYPFPTQDNVPILTLRAYDTKADENVIPQKGIEIIEMKNTQHISMCDRGSETDKQKIIEQVSQFLQEPFNRSHA